MCAQIEKYEAIHHLWVVENEHVLIEKPSLRFERIENIALKKHCASLEQQPDIKQILLLSISFLILCTALQTSN